MYCMIMIDPVWFVASLGYECFLPVKKNIGTSIDFTINKQKHVSILSILKFNFISDFLENLEVEIFPHKIFDLKNLFQV
jgi:hypothetical protein